MASNGNSTSIYTNDLTANLLMSEIERKYKFSILLILEIPGLLCNILFLYLFNWRRLQSQIYGILLIVNALLIGVELPFTLYFLYHGYLETENICIVWITLNYSLSLLSIMLMAWTSIELYIFIYYECFIVRHYILLHYVPTGLVISYSSSFYLGAVIFNTCQPAHNVNQYVCGGACYQFERTLGLIDWLGNGIIMVTIIFIVNMVLIINHLITRHRMRNVITVARCTQWRRSLRLTLQLLAIAIPYMFAWIPYSTVVLVQLFNDTEQLTFLVSKILAYFPYLQALILPYICILFIPEIKQKMFNLLNIQGCLRNRVGVTEYQQNIFTTRQAFTTQH